MMRRAFSLIELLLAVFILAIGIISISALFPAGIAQQQRAVDDQLGPEVADHALNVIRGKVTPDDFGSFEQFGIYNIGDQSQGGVWRSAPGDWSWMRPSVLTADQSATNVDDTGAVDVFSNLAQAQGGAGNTSLDELPAGASNGGGGATLYGVPYNAAKYAAAPAVAITQKERYWPMAADGQTQSDPPQYVWDCMFRKFGGKVQVAIFVYRVVAPGGALRPYVTTVTPGNQRPPVPYRRLTAANGEVTGGTNSTVTGPWIQTAPPAVGTIPGPGPFTNGVLGSPPVNLADFPSSSQFPQHQWQLPWQWLLDNNGNILRVSQGRRVSNADPAVVRLTAPIPRVQNAQVYADYETPAVPIGVRGLWYVPATDANGNQLVPVYATVRDL